MLFVPWTILIPHTFLLFLLLSFIYYLINYLLDSVMLYNIFSHVVGFPFSVRYCLNKEGGQCRMPCRHRHIFLTIGRPVGTGGWQHLSIFNCVYNSVVCASSRDSAVGCGWSTCSDYFLESFLWRGVVCHRPALWRSLMIPNFHILS